MKYTMQQINASLKRISQLKPLKPSRNCKRDLSLRETIIYMAPKLLEKKNAGVSIGQLVAELANEQIVISTPTLSSYLNRYQKMQQKGSEFRQLALEFASESQLPAQFDAKGGNEVGQVAQKSVSAASAPNSVI